MIAIKLENLWFNGLELSEGEEMLLSFPANHTQGKRAVGGKLFITNCRVAFAPNRIDAYLGGDPWELSSVEFASAGTIEPQLRVSEVFSGALRTRLAIHDNNGEAQCFVVGNPEQTASAICSALNTQTEQIGDTKSDDVPS